MTLPWAKAQRGGATAAEATRWPDPSILIIRAYSLPQQIAGLFGRRLYLRNTRGHLRKCA
jgi:hypothetical protein